MNVQVENVALPNNPLGNFEIEDAVKKIGLKNFRRVFYETHYQRNQKSMSVVS